MFDLGIVDHVRLNLTRTGQNYTVHAAAAERLASLTSRIRIGVLALVLVAAATSVMSLLDLGRSYRVAAVIAASLAFAGHAAYVSFGFEGRVNAHRVCAHNLWLVCERYRALLSEIHDGLVDRAAMLERRDELARETHSAYGQSFPLDQPAYEALRQSAGPEKQAERADPFPGPDVSSSSRTHVSQHDGNESGPH